MRPLVRHSLPGGPWFCAAFMLAACGGEGESVAATRGTPAMPAPSAPSVTRYSYSASTVVPSLSTPSPHPMAGFDNLGGTCYANAALKFLIHSTEPERLRKHLIAQVAAGDEPQREAAMKFVQLIENIHSETAPTQEDLAGFFASLQKLPSFSALNARGDPEFTIVGRAQDANDFLIKLSESFALHKLHTMALKDDNNAFKTDEEYWTILRPATAQDSLQDILDRTAPASWQVTPGQELRQLTIRMENDVDDGQGPRILGNRNFHFDQVVRLKTNDGKQTTVLTLEPREVIEFIGTDNTGHYIAYAKDEQWIRYDDGQVTVLDRMPAIENARMINFAIVKIETQSSSSS
ncbi:hypothetical protein ACFQOZ_04765 [Comamonas endophytica]|uniref:hypothetical protein n=1 Tax=Comamonas endophytica TaxID=2949090 RepID=UPI00361C9CB5